MSKQREAMEIALKVIDHINTQYALPSDLIAIGKAKQAIREALDEPEQKPVGIVRTVGGYPDDSTHTVEWLVKHKELRDGDKLYASPQTRKPLTEQEPVAWMYHGILHNGTPHDRPSLIWRPEYMDAMSAKMGAKTTPLYTAPPTQKSLTDEEIDNLELPPNGCTMRELVRVVERAHGITE